MPVVINATMTPMAVRSTGSFSVMSRIRVRRRIAVTIQRAMVAPKSTKVYNDGEDYSSFSFGKQSSTFGS
jgi:hypothetical protein